MKIIIAFPPLDNPKGIPYLSQNRQFQWSVSPSYIYPVIPAYAATMLKNEGNEVIWLDGIAGKQKYANWFKELEIANPELIVIESKTPVIKRHWQIINEIKSKLNTKIVLVGDHVTALPLESFENSQVDYILTGGDYDILLLNLVEHIKTGKKLDPGIWYREGKKIKNTGNFINDHKAEDLPMIDRELAKWQLYAFQNGNFKKTPGTYIMSGRDCWWRKNGGCTFCSWTSLYPQANYRSVESVISEIEYLVNNIGVKEIMDDAGTMMNGKWLNNFCREMIVRGLNKKVRIGCNLRFGYLQKSDYRLMAEAGFRFLLYGFESANQKTLDLINKGTKIEMILNELEMIKDINKEIGGKLEVHIAAMLGYPWEPEKEAKKTLDLLQSLYKQEMFSTYQVTLLTPYPGTKLFTQAEKEGWLKTRDWDRYDMKEPVLKTPMSDEKLMNLVNSAFSSFISFEYINPVFAWRNLMEIKNWEDLTYKLKAVYKVFAHAWDFRMKKD